MRLPVRTAWTIFLAAATMMAAVVSTSAQTYSTDPLTRAERNRVILNGQPGTLQSIDRVQGMRDFQRQHQQFREQDRPLVQPQRPRVPRMKQQDCRPRLFGNKFLSPCD
ncbi:hypothetical protein SAMN04488498_10937 [Mesorhizobium albiziae]|uniref:Uncharacterized protein n=1 Tax=Neomesorhizobium albiziae TaxID=335020 RepID=A0A1I4AX99_9HYPH|nr:hypothetical protein [Mesorhizobium albiziae]GLS34169.1 hypothetical protein GCM10007937_58840 [Mesorhizobium albiziae]SFK61054.1 hypothetical protein SAMN04488498_10937 [Mesorhizobium albiziae]